MKSKKDKFSLNLTNWVHLVSLNEKFFFSLVLGFYLTGCRHASPPAPLSKGPSKDVSKSVEGLPSFEEVVDQIKTFSKPCEGFISESIHNKNDPDPDHQSNKRNKKFQINIQCKGDIDSNSMADISMSSESFLTKIKSSLSREDLSLSQKQMLSLMENKVTDLYNQSSAIFTRMDESEQLIRQTEEMLTKFAPTPQNQNLTIVKNEEINQLMDQVDLLDYLALNLHQNIIRFILNFQSQIGQDRASENTSNHMDSNHTLYMERKMQRPAMPSWAAKYPIFQKIETIKNWTAHVREVLEKAGVSPKREGSPLM